MKRFLADMRKYKKYVRYSAKSELLSEVANSYLNWLWWIIEPFCFMLIYAFVFGTIFGAKEQYFTAFIYVGTILWQFFDHMMRSSVKLVKNNKSVVSKVYIPKYMLLFTKLFVNMFKLLIAFLIVVVLMIFLRVSVSVQVLWFVPICLVLFSFTFGICLHLMHFGVFVEDLSNIVNIFLRMMLYMTGVFYNIEGRMKNFANLGYILNHYNPIAFFISSARDALLYQTGTNIKWLSFWFIVSVALCANGVRMIYKYENSYVKVI